MTLLAFFGLQNIFVFFSEPHWISGGYITSRTNYRDIALKNDILVSGGSKFKPEPKH